jgi:hypothetical protein
MIPQSDEPAQIKLPNGLIAVMYPTSHLKMRKILKALANYASGGVNETSVERQLNIADFTKCKPMFGGRKILKINFAGTTVYLVLVITIQSAKDLAAHMTTLHYIQGFRALFAFVMYFIFNGEVCYCSTSKAKILMTAIEQNLDPNICALMGG